MNRNGIRYRSWVSLTPIGTEDRVMKTGRGASFKSPGLVACWMLPGRACRTPHPGTRRQEPRSRAPLAARAGGRGARRQHQAFSALLAHRLSSELLVTLAVSLCVARSDGEAPTHHDQLTLPCAVALGTLQSISTRSMQSTPSPSRVRAARAASLCSSFEAAARGAAAKARSTRAPSPWLPRARRQRS